MAGLIWNSRGVLRNGFIAFLKELIREFKIEFIGIQETMLRKFSNSFLRKLETCGNFKWHWLSSNGKLGRDFKWY